MVTQRMGGVGQGGGLRDWLSGLVLGMRGEEGGNKRKRRGRERDGWMLGRRIFLSFWSCEL